MYFGVTSNRHILRLGVREVAAALNPVLDPASAKVDLREKLLKAGVQPATSTPDETLAMMRAEFLRWGEVARKAGMQPQ